MEMFYQYIMAGIQVFFGLYFFVGFLHKKMKFYFYLLFAGCTAWAICAVACAVIVQWGIFILSLMAIGIFVLQKDWKTTVLYAVLTMEIMQLCYGTVKSLLSILYPCLSAFNQITVGYVFMLAGEGVSLALAGLCYVAAVYIFGFYSAPDDIYYG